VPRDEKNHESRDRKGAAKAPESAKKSATAKKAAKKSATAKKAAKKSATAKKSTAAKKSTTAKKAAKKSTTAKKKTALKPPADAKAPTEPKARWLSVGVEEGSELQAARAIERTGGVRTVLLPLHDGEALYPGYVFTECCLEVGDDLLCDICQISGVEGILSRDGIYDYSLGGHEPPVELSAEALQAIRDSCARFAKMARNEMMSVLKGQKITITSGIFSEMVGEVVSVNRRKMSVIAKVRLSDGGMMRKVSIKYGQFEVIEEQEDDGWRL